MTQIVPGLQTLSSTVNNAGGPSLSKSQEAYFKENIAPLEIDLENQRIAYEREQKIKLACFSLLVGITLVWIHPYEWEPGKFIMIIWFFTLSYLALPLLLDKAEDRYNKIYETRVYPVIFNYFTDEFTFSRDCPWTVKNLKRFSILPAFNRADKTSFVHGTYKTIEIEMLNTKLTMVEGSEDRSGIASFSGLLILLTLKKTFFGRTIVTRDKVMAPVRILGGMQCVRLESPEFNQTFNVYSEDQIEARTLLTPSFMQRLLELQKLINSRVNYSFYSGKLMIPVDRKHNYFDLQSIHNTVDIRQNFKAIRDDLQVIFEIVDILKLDLDIGL